MEMIIIKCVTAALLGAISLIAVGAAVAVIVLIAHFLVELTNNDDDPGYWL